MRAVSVALSATLIQWSMLCSPAFCQDPTAKVLDPVELEFVDFTANVAVTGTTENLSAGQFVSVVVEKATGGVVQTEAAEVNMACEFGVTVGPPGGGSWDTDTWYAIKIYRSGMHISAGGNHGSFKTMESPGGGN